MKNKILDIGSGTGDIIFRILNEKKEILSPKSKIILSDPNVKSILINIFGGIVRCDRVAQGVIDALAQMKVTIPVIIRLEGTNAIEARNLLKDAEHNFIVANSLADAAEKAVKATGEKI